MMQGIHLYACGVGLMDFPEMEGSSLLVADLHLPTALIDCVSMYDCIAPACCLIPRPHETGRYVSVVMECFLCFPAKFLSTCGCF